MKKLLLLAILSASFPSLSAPTQQDGNLPVLVVSGMKTESAVATGNGVVTVLSAGNPTQLRTALKAYSASNVRAVISFGIAGGLDTLSPGQLDIPDVVVSRSENTQWSVDAALVAELRSAYDNANIGMSTDSDAGEDDVTATDPASRAALRQATGAGIVDNESQVVAAFAKANHLPFAVVRAVSDPYNFTLPPAALIPLNPDGTPNSSAVDASIEKDPSQIPTLIQLNNDSNAAMSTLKACVQALPFGSL